MLLRGEASPLEQLKLKAEFRIHLVFMLLEMKSLDVGLCPGVVAPAGGVGAAQGIVAILLHFLSWHQCAQWHWESSEVAGLGFSWSWAVPWLGSCLGNVDGSSRNLWVIPFAACATAQSVTNQLINDQVSQNLDLEV